jgi:hypothetical protein
MIPFRTILPSLLIGAVTACSASGSDSRSSGADPQGTGTGDPSAGGSGGGLLLGNGGQGMISVGGMQCAADVHAAEGLPLDMFIMMDQSGSMNEKVSGGSKWTAVTGALSTFVQSQKTAGLSAGIQYFGLPANGGPTVTPSCPIPILCQFIGAFTSSCNPADYANPDVEIAPLPMNGAAIAASIQKHGPASDTPTLPALQGAIQHATDWGNVHSGHPTIVVLATDGDPNGCNSTPQNVAQAAAAGLAQSPKIFTFVIGVGSSLTSLNGIAQAGGTNQAFIVDTAQDVNAQFLDALNKIRGAAVLPCAYELPKPTDSSQTLDLNTVNVAYTPGVGPSAGTQTTLYQVADKSQCAAAKGGWYYDNPAAPANIQLCDETCGPVTADIKGNVSVLVGCQTQQAPLR